MIRDEIRKILDTFGRMYEHEEYQGKALDQALTAILKLIEKELPGEKKGEVYTNRALNRMIGANEMLEEVKHKLFGKEE